MKPKSKLDQNKGKTRKQSKGSRAEGCYVHILSPGAPSYSRTTWSIGSDVTRKQYDQFKDADGDLYVLVYYENRKVEPRIVLKET